MTTEKNKDRKQYIEGTISITARGGGFVDSGDKKSEDILISPDDLGTALHNDRVRVLLHPLNQKTMENSHC